MIPLKAVIFDYGKVLSIPQQPSDMEAMARVAGVDARLMHDLYWKHRAAFDRRDLSTEAYWNAVARDAGVNLANGKLDEIIRLDNESWSRPDPATVQWAARMRENGVRTSILSNMPITLRRHLAEHAHWLNDFECAIWSCDVNSIKPEPQIYERALLELGVQPADALFLDDKDENVTAARELGIHGIVFENTAQAWAELNGRYRLPPPAGA